VLKEISDEGQFGNRLSTEGPQKPYGEQIPDVDDFVVGRSSPKRYQNYFEGLEKHHHLQPAPTVEGSIVNFQSGKKNRPNATKKTNSLPKSPLIKQGSHNLPPSGPTRNSKCSFVNYESMNNTLRTTAHKTAAKQLNIGNGGEQTPKQHSKYQGQANVAFH